MWLVEISWKPCCTHSVNAVKPNKPFNQSIWLFVFLGFFVILICEWGWIGKTVNILYFWFTLWHSLWFLLSSVYNLWTNWIFFQIYNIHVFHITASLLFMLCERELCANRDFISPNDFNFSRELAIAMKCK